MIVKIVISASFLVCLLQKLQMRSMLKGKTIDAIDGRLSIANSKKIADECPSAIS